MERLQVQSSRPEFVLCCGYYFLDGTHVFTQFSSKHLMFKVFFTFFLTQQIGFFFDFLKFPGKVPGAIFEPQCAFHLENNHTKSTIGLEDLKIDQLGSEIKCKRI